MSTSPDLSAALPCHRCGYDVRAQPGDGRCPECETPVELSRRMALVPRRPAWRDSDPRWRRRMVAGAWVLVLVPLMAALQASGWAARVPVPTFYAVQGDQSLAQSFVTYVYEHVVFTIGAVLLFARERGRQVAPLDRARPWGVIGSYGVLLLGVPQFAFITSLVMLGIAAMLMTLPLVEPIPLADVFVAIGRGYMIYGLHPTDLGGAALAGVSSIVVLLACVPLFDALRSSGPKARARPWAAILLAPLALAAVIQLAHAASYATGLAPTKINWIVARSFYFEPRTLVDGVATFQWTSVSRECVAEASKWLACLAIAVWLSVAQLAAMRRRRGRPTIALRDL